MKIKNQINKGLILILSLFQAHAFADISSEKTLDDFITTTLNQHKNVSFETKTINGSYIIGSEKKFNHLNFYNIKLHEELDFNLEHYYVQQIKIKKMQNLAVNISEEHNIPLNKAEEIVMNSFIESKKKKLDPLIVLSVISAESTFNQYAKSPSGAIGLTQIIPTMHKEKIASLNRNNIDIWSIKGNIKLGTDILEEYLLLAKGNTDNALQRYNGSLNDPSKEYSKKVLLKFKKFSLAANI